MENNLEQLQEKLNSVIRQQNQLTKEIVELQQELRNLKYPSETATKNIVEKYSKAHTEIPTATTAENKYKKKKQKSNIEKFIGENLINKIGIIIIIVGVVIGVKYSIDNQLLSPVIRIILGYLSGFVLLGLGVKLKKNYENYSAVLVSGSIAILYFITYAGYSFYELIPQIPAFICMLTFTVLSVFVSIHYNRQVIAHIGLVGAYGIPFLVSSNSGEMTILFSYMAIINMGILFIAYKKYWKPLYFSSFAFTWLIFCSWYFSNYHSSQFGMTLVFLSLFFCIFYGMFLVYKLVQKESYNKIDIIPLLVNSFIFYGIGYSMIASKTNDDLWLGVFTLVNAAIHSIVCLVFYKQKPADRKLFYFTIALAITFITITIPVLLKGNWITLLWLAEAGLLFCIGRIKRIEVHEKIAYPIMFLAFFSLVQDWFKAYNYHVETQPILNIYFLTSLFAIVIFAGINYFYFSPKFPSAYSIRKKYDSILNFSIPFMFIVVLYCSFLFEIINYWEQRYYSATIVTDISLYDIKYHQYIRVINYSLIFASLLSVANQLKIRNRKLGYYSIILSCVFIFFFLTVGLYIMSELRFNNIFFLRYLSFVFAGITLYLLYRYLQQTFMVPVSTKLKMIIEYTVCISVLWLLSSELVNQLDIAGYTEKYKPGISILWGVYALLLVILGIWKNRKYLRIGGITLFAVTLLKVCFYDLSGLNTISRTIIFITLGVLLLFVSFLYNKYKNRIIDKD